MKTWVRKSISVGVMAAGGLLATQAAAQAADAITTGNYGIANGNQVVMPIQAPINLCGNSIALIGGAFASCDGGAVAVNGGGGQEDPKDNGYRKHHDDEFVKAAEGKHKKHGKKDDKSPWGDGSTFITSGNYGLLNGNQIIVPIQAPINVAGNAIGIVGGAFASATGGAVAVNESARVEGYDKGRDAGTEATLISTNNFGALNGNQLYAPIQMPINICGNAISFIGGAFASCGGGAIAVNGESARAEGASVEEATLVSTNNFGALNGNQLYAPIQIPINVCGNAIALIGGAFAHCGGGAIAVNESASTESARDEALPLVGSLPAVAGLPVVGSLASGASAPTAPKMDAPGARSGATEGDDYDGDRGGKKHGKKHGKDAAGGFGGAVAINGPATLVSSGNFGALNGNQLYAPIQAPINVAGNAIGIVGGAFAQSTGGALAVNG
ncbi:chaplin family protein [Asanoa iriomotensis]|uniref:Chaplin domain-containing protein n=1 Tax=Asanoa iriomotensis TaxID=234613 RepID=A0ABQ4CGF1_9ACTN|nr:chaplin family protein [Asanoa iriomotensis]GIF61853.1 hypothetical protein Air01nite_79480 [Asanoa iriomotensis]